MTLLRPQMSNGLHWVRSELDQSLTRARGMIEQYVENPKDTLPLQQAFVELHQIRGTAAMIQCFGVAAFSEEMRQGVHELMHGKVAQTEAAFSTLLGATVQLADYIDALASGMDDCLLVLHPAINELRVARGRPVLSEAELFAIQMQGLNLQVPIAASPARGEGRAQALAVKLLPLFQVSLLHWLNNQPDPKNGIARIGKIAEQLAGAAVTAPVQLMWRVTGATAEALLSLALDESIEVKRLFGAAGKQIKLLAEDGESAASARQGDLAYQLLFYTARSRAKGSRVSSLRQDLQLEAYLPTAAQVEALRPRIHGPTTSLLRTVAEEIRADLGQIKDSIDLAVRAGGKLDAKFEDTRVRLKRVADTLSTLGLQMLQRVVQNQILLLGSANQIQSAEPGMWMEIATALLRVEHSLDAALFRQLRQSPLESAAGRPELEEQVPHSRDLGEGVQALLRESLVSLSKLKTLVDAYLKTGESSGLAEAARMLDEISAGLLILENERASMLTAQLERFIRSPMFAQLRESRERADRFADAIACVEYYLEALRDQSPQAQQMLENLANFSGLLDFTEPAEILLPDIDLSVALEDASATEPASIAAIAAIAATAAPPVQTQDVDPEIREIFLEEAGDVLRQLQTVLPRWARNPEDRESLTTLRRAFHTLKGSGRMVGATAIGDFGWAVENLINRCLDQTLTFNADIAETVQQAANLLPGLIEDFRENRPPAAGLAQLLQRAENLSSGRGATASVESDIAAIFRDDARDKLASITQWLGQQDRNATEFQIDEAVVRAFHTLRGAASVVAANALAELAGALETYLDSTRSGGLHLPRAALDLLDEAAATLLAWVEGVGSAVAQSQDAGPWLARIEQLQARLPASAVKAGVDRQLAAIFTEEALELLKKIEQTLNNWSRAPDNRQPARELKNDCHTLMGAALMSDCPSIAVIARAVHDRMHEAIASPPMPDAHFFGQMNLILEDVYQLLDRFRAGLSSGDGAEIAARIRELPWSGGAPVAVTAASAPSETPALAAAVTAEPYAAKTDSLLREMFLAEGQELLESIDAYSAAWEHNPLAAEPQEKLAQVAHTLKGSALMAGLPDLGEAAHRLKHLIAHASPAGTAPDSVFFDRLHHVSDSLHRVFNDMQHGTAPDIASLLAELAVPLTAAPAPLPLEEIPEQIASAPASLDFDLDLDMGLEPETLAATPFIPQPVVVAPAPQVTAPALDADLAEIFIAEAGELIETLEKSLNAWESNPHNVQALRDMQHALHTLKGGARMSGLEIMGTLAHDMETRVNGVEQSPQAADANAFSQLMADLEGLQGMLDALQRGEAIVAPASPPADVTAVAQTRAAPLPPDEPEAPLAAAPVKPRLAIPAGWNAELFWRPEEDLAFAAMRRETARVPVEVLDGMLNQAGEISIYRSRLVEHNSGLQSQLQEMTQAITRLREQLRMMDIETDAQISARGIMASGKDKDRYEGDFDPLEMDRYTRMQELSRALSESVGDLANLRGSMEEMASEAETLLLQQGRINTEVQTGLMGTLMVPFSRQVARLQRVVKQTAQETGKQAEALFSGIESELDRNVLERMTAPLEHLLRNSVVHGIEEPGERRSAGKADMGQVQVKLWREGTQLLIELRDDGKGLDLDAIRATAILRGLIAPEAEIPDDAVAQFIFEPGFSTAKQLTQAAGRGIGMDVVAAEVKQLGGTLELGSQAGRGARFLVRLPLTLSISQALLVGVGKEQFAIPLPSIEGIARIPVDQLENYYREDGQLFKYGPHDYRVRHLGEFIGIERERALTQKTVNAILVRLGEGLGAQERHVAVVVDGLYGNREVVSKAVGPQVSSISGVSGATILADGSVVLILDVPALAADRTRRILLTQSAGDEGAAAPAAPLAAAADTRELIMVVDDSITIRRVTERLLQKNGYRVVTAKDGLDAMAQLQTVQPATVLLDIEMPRADGFEVATFIRNTENLRRIPIIMITSRSGDKHRERARQIGVNRYLIKPFQEEQLVGEIREVMQEAQRA